MHGCWMSVVIGSNMWFSNLCVEVTEVGSSICSARNEVDSELAAELTVL